MNKKKLPRAVTRTATEMRNEAGADAAAPAPNSGQEVSVVAQNSTDIDSKQRLARANAVVERYANFSGLGGAIPLPLLNVASVTMIIVRMVKVLCGLYGVPYERGRARALVVGLAGGAVPTTASAVTTTTLIYVVPGVNLLGLAVSCVTASICTRAIGRRFVDHFETGANLMDFQVVDRR